jgi:hypothetical protein
LVFVLGVVLVLGAVLVLLVLALVLVLVDVLDCVVLAPAPDPLGAAAAPAMPATTPPAPSAAVTSTARNVFARFIELRPPGMGVGTDATHPGRPR